MLGCDFFDAILAESRQAAAVAGLAGRIELRQADLTAPDFASGILRQVVCWVVLMHVPADKKVVAELVRVLVPCGRLVVSEGTLRSIQAVTLR